MTPAQRVTVNQLVAEGFSVTVAAKEIVRVTRFGDRRVVFQDGSQKRGYHEDFRSSKA